MTELSSEDKQFIKELREQHEAGKINRRQALGMLGAAGVGAAGGFFGAGTASADNHTDSQGNIGLPSDPVDGWFDSINPPGGSGSGNSTSIQAIETEEVNTVAHVGQGDSLQAAIDNLSSVGERVVVESDYDTPASDFPLTTDTPFWLDGRGKQKTVLDPGDSTTDILDFDFSSTSTGDRAEQLKISNIQLRNGNDAITLNHGAYTRIVDTLIKEIGGTGITTTGTGSHELLACRSVDISKAGGRGIDLGSGSAPNAALVLNSNIIRSGDVGINARGRALGIQNSAIEKNDGFGIDQRAGTLYLDQCYLEDNDSNTNLTDINLRASGAHQIKSCYFNGVDRLSRAVNINGANSADLRGCTYRSYTDGFVTINTGNDNDINGMSHLSLDATPLVASDGATRTRSHGYIGGPGLGGVDLNSVSGQEDGDVAIASGATITNGFVVAVWDDTNTRWVYPDSTGTQTPA